MKPMSIAALAAITALGVSFEAAAVVSDHIDIYGVIAASLDSVDNGGDQSTSTQGVRNLQLSSNASRIGFKGDEDLGGGLGAIWQIESLIYIDGCASSTLATRNSFVGLRNSLGILMLGRYDTPYKRATRSLDSFGLSLADNRSLLGGVSGKGAKKSFDGRQSNSLFYQSPEAAGLSFAAAYVMGSETVSVPGQQKGCIWSMAGRVRREHWSVAVATETHRFGDPGTGTLAGGANGAFAAGGSKESAWKVGLDYRRRALELAAVYEKTHDDLGGTGSPAPVSSCTRVGQDCYGHHAYYMSGKFRFGADDVKLAYGRAGGLAGMPGDGAAWQISFGYDHPLGERTRVFALYTRLGNARDIDYGLTTSTVTSGSTPAAGAGATLSGLSVGLRHAF